MSIDVNERLFRERRAAIDSGRATALIEGADDEMKTKAHKRLMRLVSGGVERR